MNSLNDAINKALELQNNISTLLEHLRNHNELLSGSIYTSRTRCGRPNCRCMTSTYRHESSCLSFSEKGKSRTRTIPAELAANVATLTEAYRAARQQRREIARLNKDLLACLDYSIKEATECGRAHIIPRLSTSKKVEK